VLISLNSFWYDVFSFWTKGRLTAYLFYAVENLEIGLLFSSGARLKERLVVAW
jgi:hypothetical protein